MNGTLRLSLGLIVLLASCTGDTGGIGDKDPCGDGTLDCFNLDFPIDGEEEANQIPSEDAHLCMANDGRLYATWIDARNNFRDVWFNSSLDGGRTWFPTPIRVKKGAGDASNVSIDCAGDRVYVAWEDTRDSDTAYENIYVNFSSDGGVTWRDEDTAIDNDPEGRSISLAPQIAIYQGSVHVVWFDQSDGAPDVYVSSSNNGGVRFRAPINISANEDGPGAYWSGNPRVAVDRSGRLHVVWEDTRWGTQDIFYARSNSDASEFEEPIRLSNGNGLGNSYAFAPSMSIDGDDICVVWHDTRGGDARDIYMNCSNNLGNAWFENPERVETDAPGANESFNARVIMLDGSAHIVWQDNRLGGYDIYYRRWTTSGWPTDSNGDPIEDERVDRDPTTSNSIDPVLFHREGTFLVGWSDQRASGSTLNDLYYNYMTLDEEGLPTAWSDDDYRVDSIQAGTKFADDLNLALFENEVYALWVDNRDGDGDTDIYFSHSALGEGVDTYESIVEATQ
ncbi:MAG: hypothetical protein H6733_02950 [Alphaproteobacteria bacterium]|nr:hypothetical protein [Alphaproteobacteria bacterium]